MFLHAWKLELPHPVAQRKLALEAPIPPELREALARVNLPAPP
jgi:23S rRNA pseudouridine955/2504/2580 synthase